MTYPAINARRMPYDIDGCEIGTNIFEDIDSGFMQGIADWLDASGKNNLNSVQRSVSWESYSSSTHYRLFWFFFPERREITHLALYFMTNTTIKAWNADSKIQGSNDTTNGMDGTWETATATIPPVNIASDYWRSQINTVSFSESKKVIRFGMGFYDGTIRICGVHLYGQKTAGQTPDDILFVDASTGVEFTALKDWGDRPEGTTVIWSFKVKNASTSKIANNVNIQLNHSDFAIAWAADGPWQSVLDIASIGIGALSNTIYIRNQLAPPLLTLGPKQARVIATVGSWT